MPLPWFHASPGSRPRRGGASLTIVVAASAVVLVLVTSCDARRKPSAEPRGQGRASDAQSTPGEVRVTSVRVKDRTSTSDQMVRFRPDELRHLVIAQLHQQPGFRVEDRPGSRDPLAHRVKVDLELQSLVGTEKGKASVLVSLDLSRIRAPADEPGYLGSALQERVYKLDEPGSLRDVYRTLIERALAEVLRGVALEVRLRAAPARLVSHAIRTSRLDELDLGWSGQVEVWQPLALPGQLSLLGEAGLPGLAAAQLLGWTAPTTAGGEGPDVRELAIKIAALRRLREAVPVLVATLEQERRERIRDLCLGALAEIRDESAVPALTRYSKFGDLERLRKVIGVLGQIGGAQARAFLEMTADSHADGDLQQLARETLERLPKTKDPPTAPRP